MAKTRNKASEAWRAVLDLLDRETEPRSMSKAEALELLEELGTDLEARIEALKHEIAEEEGMSEVRRGVTEKWK